MSQPERAPQGGPDESEVPVHTGSPDDVETPPDTLEDSAAYETAVEDGRPLPPDAVDENADIGGDGGAPEFREPPSGPDGAPPRS